MPRRILTLFCAASLVATVASATPIGYATDANSDLYSIDFGTGIATLIGPEGAFLEGLALSPTGDLYGTDTSGSLYSVSTSTGAATLIGGTGLGNVEGLDFNGSTLVATDFNSTATSFYSLDTGTAAPAFIQSANTGVTRAMAIQDGSTALVLSDAPALQTLASVNLTTGAFANVGPTIGSIFGMDFGSDGTLYGVGPNGVLSAIDPLTGATTFVGDTGNQTYLGLAMASPQAQPVPEPASLFLLGTGLAFAGARKYRRVR